MALAELARQGCADYARKQLGKPYYIGKDGPDEFDCNGLIEQAWKSVDRYPWDERRSASHYWEELEHIEWQDRKVGDVVCYGSDNICHHVMLVTALSEDSSQDGKQIGACHGRDLLPGEAPSAYRGAMKARGASVVEVSDWYWKTARLGVVRNPKFNG